MFYFMYYHICVCHVSINITYLLTYLLTVFKICRVIRRKLQIFVLHVYLLLAFWISALD